MRSTSVLSLPLASSVRPETEFVGLHVHLFAAEANAFGFKAETLFERIFAAKFDFAAGAENALPGEADGAMKGSGNLAGGTGESGGSSDGSVS